ncbi:uncharacterized protein TRIADDRAFT_53213 [Trichoplax adhaerens]|uniref:Uncharacterized protein n=1 Tax=Trichoplax adhaerens TaxID=10228 RepID=B3RNM0_TRIAD|nr:predicted protein [Trichoplax adhaerens]EDV28041.1 predicted protein [Trichoplax adhaerens]|eukprot:XP_002109875.1 predicted protein [Trichoplax adhaerens]
MPTKNKRISPPSKGKGVKNNNAKKDVLNSESKPTGTPPITSNPHGQHDDSNLTTTVNPPENENNAMEENENNAMEENENNAMEGNKNNAMEENENNAMEGNENNAIGNQTRNRKPKQTPPSPDSNPRKDTPSNRITNRSVPIILVCFCILALIFLHCIRSNVDRKASTLNEMEAISQSRKLIQDLKNHFSSQTENTWKKLAFLAFGIYNTGLQREKPLVFTLAHRSNAFKSSRCLIMKLLDAIPKPFMELNVHGEYSRNHALDENLEHSFLKQLNKALTTNTIPITNKLHALNPKLARQFQSYCDNDDAPFKQAVILFHVALNGTYDDNLLSSNEIYVEKEVTKVLKNSWSPMEEFIFDPLSARILQNIVVINSEEDFQGC